MMFQVSKLPKVQVVERNHKIVLSSNSSEMKNSKKTVEISVTALF